MKDNLTEIIFILDRSGSMSDMTQETIGGFNSLIEKHKKEKNGDIYITTVLFDNYYEILHEHVAIDDIAPLTDKDYFARGSTALMDAVGKTIDSVGERLSATKEEDRPSNIILVITTDGYENCSRIYSKSKVKKLIKQQKEKYNWKFLFLGADIDAAEEADAMGIGRECSIKTSRNTEGIRRQYNIISAVASKCIARPTESFETLCEEAFVECEEK